MGATQTESRYSMNGRMIGTAGIAALALALLGVLPACDGIDSVRPSTQSVFVGSGSGSGACIPSGESEPTANDIQCFQGYPDQDPDGPVTEAGSCGDSYGGGSYGGGSGSSGGSAGNCTLGEDNPAFLAGGIPANCNAGGTKCCRLSYSRNGAAVVTAALGSTTVTARWMWIRGNPWIFRSAAGLTTSSHSFLPVSISQSCSMAANDECLLGAPTQTGLDNTSGMAGNIFGSVTGGWTNPQESGLALNYIGGGTKFTPGAWGGSGLSTQSTSTGSIAAGVTFAGSVGLQVGAVSLSFASATNSYTYDPTLTVTCTQVNRP
jgi:hypothetical protein